MTARLTPLQFAALVLLAMVPAVPRARADTLDTSMPRVVVVGAARGIASSDRLDSHRTGRAHTRLPEIPVEQWRRHVSGGIDVLPLVDAEGNILVALTMPEIVKLGPDAKEIWRARLGTAAPLAPPTLLSDGTITVVTAAGIAWGFTKAGVLRFSVPLGVRGRDVETAPLALADGGFLVAAGANLVAVDGDGAVRARATLDDRTRLASASERAAGGLIETGGYTVITTEAGSVYRFRPPAAPRRIGSFGGSTRRGAVLFDDRTLLAVVDGHRVVAFDLMTGTTHVRLSGPSYDAPPVIGSSGIVLITTFGGMLLGLDSVGNEKLHVPLERPLPTLGAGLVAGFGTGGVVTVADLKPSPAPIVDPAGRVGFVRGNGRVGVVSTEGRVTIAAERLCSAPVAVVPAGDARMLVACRDGGLWMYGE